MMNKARLGVQTKAAQPADEDFEDDANEIESARMARMQNFLREWRDEAAFIVDVLSAELAYRKALAEAAEYALNAAQVMHSHLKADEDNQPKQPTPVNQQEIEERHRAPF